MQLRPIGDHLIVKPLAKEETSASGIIIPETAEKERPEQGTVLAIGPGKLLENGTRSAMDVAVGNKILFKKYSPDEFKLEEKEYLVVSASDIIAIIE